MPAFNPARGPAAPGRLGVFVGLMLAALLGPGCRKERPASAPAAPAQSGKSVSESLSIDGLLFVHATLDGRFETVEKVDDIPASARGVVRVLDPGQGPGRAQDPDQVLVIDASQVTGQKVAPKPLSRLAFESRALAMLPAGESSAMAEAPVGGALTDAGMEPSAGVAGQADVIVYGTSWCGACRSARRFMVEKGIPFVDKDVEKDQAAARELQEKAVRVGIDADRVPILEVRGRLLIGFDPVRVQRLLGITP